MSRPLRIEFAGAVYHVMARGNASQPIFVDDKDRRDFINNLARVCERFQWRLWAWCLMDNHYHLLIETLQPNLSRGMRQVNGVYTQAFNRRHERVGHVLQGRYKALLVDKDNYLLELLRYIVLNPVRAGLCESAGEWPWSSYPATMGKPDRLGHVAVADTLALFSEQPAAARRAFARFVEEGIDADAPQQRQQLYVGNDAFVEQMMAHHRTEPASTEVPRRQRTLKLLQSYERDAADRDAAIRAAYTSGDYTLKEIGEHFGLHYATVSRIARRRIGQNKT